jgi:hypothetical protein
MNDILLAHTIFGVLVVRWIILASSGEWETEAEGAAWTAAVSPVASTLWIAMIDRNSHHTRFAHLNF